MSLDAFDEVVQRARAAGLAPCRMEPTGRPGLVCCVVHKDLVDKGRELCDAALAVAHGEDPTPARRAQRMAYEELLAQREPSGDHFPIPNGDMTPDEPPTKGNDSGRPGGHP